ncbi:hypothetical protein [Helicobacter sp. T3_23-1056]
MRFLVIDCHENPNGFSRNDGSGIIAYNDGVGVDCHEVAHKKRDFSQ